MPFFELSHFLSPTSQPRLSVCLYKARLVHAHPELLSSCCLCLVWSSAESAPLSSSFRSGRIAGRARDILRYPWDLRFSEGSPGPKCKSFPVDPSACREKKTSQVFGPKMEEMPDVDHVSWIQLPLYEDGSIQKFTVGYIRLLMFGCWSRESKLSH